MIHQRTDPPEADRPTRSIGRRRELATLVGLLDALWRSPREVPAGVRAGGAVVMLVGEPGIGKTQLAQEFAALAGERGALVLWGTAVPNDAGPAHGPWSDILATLAARSSGTLAEDLGDAAPPVARAVPDVRRMLPGIAPATPLEPADERIRLWDGVARWLRRTGQRSPVVLVLDDLDSADEDTARMLRYVARTTARSPLLIVGVYRETPRRGRPATPLTRLLDQLRIERPYHRIAVRGFAAGDVGALLGDGVRIRLGPVAVRALARITRGNPWFVEVARRLLVDAWDADDAAPEAHGGRPPTDVPPGAPTADRTTDDARSTPAAAATDRTPTGPTPWPVHADERRTPAIGDDAAVHDRSDAGRWPGPLSGLRRREQLLDQRIARRSTDAASLLSIVAALPEPASRALLSPISELAPPALLDALDENVRAGLVVSDGTGEAPVWRVAHPIVRDAFEGRWTVARRAHLHRRVAQALEHLAAGREREEAAALGWHYHASAAIPGAERGVRYLLLAAEAARGASAHVRAATMLRMAVDCARRDDPATYADLLGRLAQAEADAVLPEARQTLETVVRAMADARLPATTIVSVITDVLASIDRGGSVGRTVIRPIVDRGLTLVRADRGRDWARLKLLAETTAPRTDATRAIVGRPPGHDAAAVAVLRGSPIEDDRADILRSGDVRTRAETDAILASARTWRRQTAAMRAWLIAVEDLVECHGAFREGAVEAAALVEAARRHGVVRTEAAALLELSLATFALGDIARAVASLSAADRRLTAVDETPGLASLRLAARLTRAYYLDLGWHDLERMLGRRLRDAPTASDPDVPRFVAWSALTALRTGRPEVAETRLSAAIEHLATSDPGATSHGQGVAVAGVVAWELGAGNHAQALRSLAERLAEHGGGTLTMGSPRLTIARMTALQGDGQGAVRSLSQERASLDAWDLSPLAVIAAYDAGVAMWTTGARDVTTAEAILRQAVVLFRSLGMAGWSQRAQSQADALVRGDPDAARPAQLTFPDLLTAREIEVLRLVAGGAATAEIASRLFLDPMVVRRHLSSLVTKAGVDGADGLREYAMQRGLVPPVD